VLALPAVTMTTANSVALFPCQASPPLPAPGVPIGLDDLAGGERFALDPWSAYQAGILTSPNMLVLGQLGTGKSALVKTYARRQAAAGRWIGVLDPKGEYGALADALGLAHLALRPGGPDRLNPLDLPPGADPVTVRSRRAELAGALAAAGLKRDLAPAERAGVAAAGSALGAHPVLADLVELLLRPTETMAANLALSVEALAVELRTVGLELRRALDGDLAGMVDAPTTVDEQAAARGLVIDLSHLFDTAALAPVMACVTGWLAAHTHAAGRHHILICDEAWALLAQPQLVGWLQATAKLARHRGAQLVLVTHRASDLTAQADAGSAAERQAAGLLADTGIRVIHAQAPDQLGAAARLLGLTAPETALISTLPAHQALWLLGADRPAVATHLLGPGDDKIIDTNQAMQP
jgi:type IV secretory pathway VirB4 component